MACFWLKKNGGDPQPLTNESWDDPPSVKDLNFFLRQGRLSQKVVFTQAGFMNRYTEKNTNIYIYIYIYIYVYYVYIYIYIGIAKFPKGK